MSWSLTFFYVETFGILIVQRCYSSDRLIKRGVFAVLIVWLWLILCKFSLHEYHHFSLVLSVRFDFILKL